MAGQPTKLTQELIDKAREYLPTCVDVIPTIEGLALFLHVSKQSIYTWSSDNYDDELSPQFFDVFEEIKNEQGQRLINGGLYGRFNATITKLMLSKHGYVEKLEQDVTSKGEKLQTAAPTLVDSFVDRLKDDSADQAKSN